MKKKALALLLAGSMLFGQNVYATDMASTEKNADANITDITENMSETEHDSEAVIAHDAVFILCLRDHKDHLLLLSKGNA